MKSRVRIMLLLLGDTAMMVVAFFIMLGIAFPKEITRQTVNSHLFPFIIVFCIWLLVFFLFNLYETQSVKPTIPHLKKIGISYIVALTASTVLFYVIPTFGITPKTNLIIFSIIFLLLFLAWRRIFYSIFSVYFRKSVAFITDPDKDNACTGEILNYIETYPQSGFLISGVYSSLKEFLEKRNGTHIDTLIISKNALEGTQDMKLVYSTVENILDLTYAYEDILGKVPIDSIDETWFLYNIHSINKTFDNTVTFFLNITVAFIVLVVTSPFLLLVALFIKLEGNGPILYTQPRVGINNKIFKLYKFRSMVTNADQGGAEWTEKDDPRITKVGKIIRRLHIDEIPQLWNVLRGEMALVGPRPEIPSFEDKLRFSVRHYNMRHIITPGFTGWAQIKYRNARGIAESKEKFEYDLYYIKNRNIFMDLGILFRTIVIIFTHDS